MANCKFTNGLTDVHGTLSKKVYYDKGVKHVMRVVATCRNGKQRVYLREERQRSTPVSQSEMRARERFTKVAEQLKNLTEEQKQNYSREMRKAKCKFNGKTYKSLRGYIMARMHAELDK